MMTDPEIKANGVISVISNIAPAAVERMCQRILTGEIEEAKRIKNALSPLFDLVTVNWPRQEKLPSGEVSEVYDKFRNPLPIKTMMNGLGMPAGPCRRPLGKMTAGVVGLVREKLTEVWKKNTWVLKPIEDFCQVDISARLADNKIWKELSY